jgi:hypothetical protein
MYGVDIIVTGVTCSNRMHIEVTYEDHLNKLYLMCAIYNLSMLQGSSTCHGNLQEARVSWTSLSVEGDNVVVWKYDDSLSSWRLPLPVWRVHVDMYVCVRRTTI